MNEIETLKLLGNMFALENDKNYTDAVITLAGSCSQEEGKKALETVFKAIAKSFASNACVTEYLSDGKKATYDEWIKDIYTSDYSDKPYISAVLDSIYTDSHDAMMSSCFDELRPSLLDTIKTIGHKDMEEKVGKLEKNTDLDVKKEMFTSCINELLVIINQKMMINAKEKTSKKKLSPEAQKRLNDLKKLFESVRDSINSEFTDINAFRNNLRRLIILIGKLGLLVEKKQEDRPLKQEDKPSLGLEGDIEPTKDNSSIMKKRIISAVILSTTLAMFFGMGIYVSGADFNHKQPENPGVSDSPDPTDSPSSTPNIEDELKQAKNIVHQNWAENNSELTEDEIGEVIKALNGGVAAASIEDVDSILVDMLNLSVIPAINNLLVGETNPVAALDFSTLILGDKEGIKAVEDMEDYLNGCLTDPENRESYCSKALNDMAVIIGEEKTLNGMSLADDSKTDPALRLVWSRLALGINGFAGTIDNEVTVTVNGKTYSFYDVAGNLDIGKVAEKAKEDLGSKPKTIILD